MLSRRQLRIKTVQALYAFFQSEDSDMNVASKELFRSIEKVNDLYFLLLLLLTELAHHDLLDAGEVHLKHFPKEEEVNTKKRFHQLKFITALNENTFFKSTVASRALSWSNEQEMVRIIFLEIKKSALYKAFLLDEKADEKGFLLQTIKQFIENSETLNAHLSDKNMHWNTDLSFCFQIVSRSIKKFYDNGVLEFSSFYKDEKDDKEFVKLLFEKTIVSNKEFDKDIADKTKNWDVDRIALVDILLMKMALTEMTTFSSIPVKVTINEYIDISKDYSTPKSNIFINGIIDKLAIEYKAAGKIQKTGRGLLG